MDIDIDLPSNFDHKKYFPAWAKASNILNGNIVPHPVGAYCEVMPLDPISCLAAIPYKVANELDYFKIDFLHLTIYDHFNSKDEIDFLLTQEPEWELLKSPSIVKQLFQLSNHFDVVKQCQPKSIDDLADVIALIRPGKIQLLNKYLENKEKTRRLLYLQNENDQYNYKKSHAIAYAHVIVLQLHLISAGVEFD